MDLSAIQTIDKVEVAGKRVLVRLDLDVPLEEGRILDDFLVRAALPTIEHLVERNARLVLMSHLGHPAGKVDPKLSLEVVAARLAELLPAGEVILADAPVGDGAKRVALDLRDGQVAVLENLRFHVGETANDDKFSRGLASLGEVFVADAFNVLQNTHASTVGVARHIPHKAMGFLVQRELEAFDNLTNKAERPYVAVVGGTDFSDKVSLIQSLMERADVLILGGAVANTFNAAKGASLGRSDIERDKHALARDLMRQVENAGTRLILPTDIIAAEEIDAEETVNVTVEHMPETSIAVDVGEASRARFKDAISRAKTVFWNGPMGVYENRQFAGGTIAVAKAIAGSAAYSVVVGDGAVTSVRKSGLEKGFNHVSTGGGALLRLLSGKVLPGLQALVGHQPKGS